MKKKLLIVPVILAGLLAGCGNQPGPSPEPTPDPIPVQNIELSKQGQTMYVGEKLELKYTITPNNATNKEVTWSSTDESVAKYENGFVYAYKEGSATIKVTTVDQNVSDQCWIEVYPGTEIIHVESISLDQEEVNIEVGKTANLSYTILPSNATNKNVTWTSDDSSIATVENGKITGKSAGNTDIFVISRDENKIAKCSVIVSEPVTPPSPDPVETKSEVLDPKSFDKETHPLNKTIENVTFDFAQADGTYVPGYYTGNNGQFTLYQGNELTISSKKGTIKNISFEYKARSNEILADSGTMSSDYASWTGSTKSLVLTVGNGTDTKVKFGKITVTYEISTHHDPIDLGYKTIKEVKEYILNAVDEEVFDVNAYGMGADKYTTVTIKGLAMAKIGLSKSTSQYGYNITEPNKVVIGDATDAIAVASKTGDGTLYGKVSSHQMKSTSKYSVTGYISMNLGMPELICTSYSWDQNQEETADISKISKAAITLTNFYTKATNVNYNISGFGYGDVYTIKDLTCYYSEADGQGKTWYNFTDGTNNIRVNAYNIGRISVGGVYDVTGMISLANYSPIIIAFSFKNSTKTPVNLEEFYKSASEMSIENLKKINYVNDTTNKYPDMINNYSKIYKTTGYITTVQEGGKYYLGISDSYVDTKDFPTGKAASSVKYNLALIKNDNFWNLDDPYFKFNPYAEITDMDVEVTVYYTPRQTGFYNGKMYWEILLIPQSIVSAI